MRMKECNVKKITYPIYDLLVSGITGFIFTVPMDHKSILEPHNSLNEAFDYRGGMAF